MGLASITNNILTDTSIPSANVITGTLASGQVAYGSAANTIAGSNNLFWDNAQTRLGIGTNTPSYSLQVAGGVLVGTVNLTHGSFGSINARVADGGIAYTATNGNGILYISISGDQATIQSSLVNFNAALKMSASKALYLSNSGIQTPNSRIALLTTENNDVTGTRTPHVTIGESLGNNFPSPTSIVGFSLAWRSGFTVNATTALDGQTAVTGMLGSYFVQQLRAPTNNSVLAAVVINPTFNDNAFTGNTKIALGISNADGYSIYQNSSTALNYFNGNVLIGSATNDGTNKLQVTGSILATTNSTISGLSVGKGAGNIATNTALGASALITNSTGAQNTAVGNDTLRLNTTGLQNSAFGYRSSRATTTGAGNSSFGIDTLRVNSIGNYNSAFGAQALDNNTADNNTATGSQALLDNTSGTNNTAIGYRAGYAGSLLSNVSGSNNIFIGADSVGESTSASNRTFIGNTSTTSTWLGGRLLLGSRTDDAANRLQVTGASALVGTTYVNTNASIAGYNHSLQVLANAAGGMIVSTTNSASAIGIVNSASANKTWDISPNGNDLAINESGVATRMYFLAGGNTTIGGITNSGNLLEVLGTFKTTGVNTLSNLGGVGSRMVVADANGVLSTQAIPGGSITGSGAAGQVTFWTGASTLGGSNNLFWDAANSRLGINTNTPTAGYVLNVNGTSLFNDNLSLSKNVDGINVITVSNTSSGTSAESRVTLISDGSSNAIISKRASTSLATGIITASDFGIYNGVSGDIAIYNAVTTTGRIKFSAGGIATPQMILFANGNLGINVGVSDGGERLQVIGRAVANNSVTQGAFGTGNRIGLFGVQTIDVPTVGPFNQGTVTAAGTSAQYMKFNGNTTIGGDALVAGSVHINSVEFTTTGTITMADSATLKPRTLSVMQLQMQKAGTVGGTVTKGSTLYLFGVYPTTSTGGTVTFTEYAGLRIGNLTEWTGGPLPNNTVSLTNRWGIYQEGDTDPNYFAGSIGVGVATNNASAKLQVDSTTQGFLPPRMTNAQMNAIATPAAGLIVYNTTDNKHYGYNGTTWNAFY